MDMVKSSEINRPRDSAMYSHPMCQNMSIPQISKVLLRQSLPKDLPLFSGDSSEWPNFIYQFRHSTKVCGYTDEENQCRLQKCLKGSAGKVVQSLLIMPQNVQ